MSISNTYWTDAGILDSLLIPDIPQALRYTITNTEDVLENEHVTFPDASNLGCYHQTGSAKCYSQSAAPTTKLNGEAWAAEDNGTLWLDTDTDILYVLTAYGTPTWTPLPSVTNANTWAETPVWTKGVVANNTALTARNNADDGNVTLVTVTTGDVVTLPDGVVATTQSASDGSTKLATCKYADDAGETWAPVDFAADSDSDSRESITFPNGLIIKQGIVSAASTDVTVTFDTAFPNGVVSAQATAQVTAQLDHTWRIDGLVVGSMHIKAPAGSTITNYYWQAWGY